MLGLSLILTTAAAAGQPQLRPELQPLSFLIGHCWEGRFERSGEVDRHCFESVYGGQHVRDRHEVTGGKSVYRGETLYSWDGKAKVVTYTYWNSLGGVSRGTMRPGEGRLDFGNESYTGPDGRQLTISTHWRLEDGAYQAVSASPQSPSMNRTVRYARSAPDISVSDSRAPNGTHTLVHELVVPAHPEQVWQAISTAEGWKTWAAPAAWAAAPDIIETSYTPTAAPGDKSTIRQQLLARIPGRMVVFRTIKAPEAFPDFDTYRNVTSVLELEPVGEGSTKVRLTGAGYADSEAGRRLLGFFRKGNSASLGWLRDRFVSGPKDWSKR